MLKTKTFQRGITRKSITKRTGGPKLALEAKSQENPMAKGLVKLKKTTTKSNEAFIHDYSVFPEMLQYRLPTEAQLHEPVKPHSNIIKLLFEEGGVESMDWKRNQEKFNRYPLTTPEKLNRKSERPGTVKMLSSDFIDDSLYNSNYGYFAKEAVIFQPDRPFDYNQLQGKDEFMDKWLEAYEKYDKEHTQVPGLPQKKKPVAKGVDKAAASAAAKEQQQQQQQQPSGEYQITKPSLQLWHTPTELFQPFYGEALARYILVNYKLNSYPYNDLIIYEAGAGNGTLMLNVLDYIKENEPEVYERTKYRIIEISSKLFNKQNSRLRKHREKVEIINESVLEWNTTVNEPCFFIALEVWDNFSHDVIRYDNDTKQPYQGYVVIDEHNDFQEYYSPDLDYWAREFLKLREEGQTPIATLSGHPLNQLYPLRKARAMLNPLRNNLSDPEYIPTRLLKFFTVLKRHFPNHQLIASDFTHFDKTIPGYNSPTVQTMHRENMVNVDTYMVEQGYFDIMFPTDFQVMNGMYQQVTGKTSATASHRAFLEKWAETESTRTKSGENPMLELYSNAAFLYS